MKNQIQGKYGSIMLIVMQSMRVDKMRINCAKIFYFIIHHVNKLFYTAANMFCNGYSCIISRKDQKRIQKITQYDLISFFKTAQLSTIFRNIGCIMTKCDCII